MRLVAIIAAGLIGLVAIGWAATARADAAAGAAAFDKGDYVRAMAEWTSAADRGDPDAEFGLGMLYERGEGELRQSYKEADRWYQKAADHDHVGAEYRLALIWSAGTDNFAADYVEAYKWILLASERGLATDVKAQLERVLDRRQMAEGQKRAASWKEAHAAKKAEPPPTLTTTTTSTSTAAIPPPRTTATSGTTTATTGGKSGGCPGWPFPTLPCTEQFPSLPGATAPRTSNIPPPRAD